MNYRHAYHAGNFADVVKHAVLARVLVHLRDKPAAFRVIDTHAGAGRTDLAGPEASKTQEWRGGIDRLRRAELTAEVRDLRPISDRADHVDVRAQPEQELERLPEDVVVLDEGYTDRGGGHARTLGLHSAETKRG